MPLGLRLLPPRGATKITACPESSFLRPPRAPREVVAAPESIAVAAAPADLRIPIDMNHNGPHRAGGYRNRHA